jgi:phage/plasmid-associated DNA primase
VAKCALWDAWLCSEVVQHDGLLSAALVTLSVRNLLESIDNESIFCLVGSTNNGRQLVRQYASSQNFAT